MSAKLETILRATGPAAIAVSGGIDSLTLARLSVAINPKSIVYHAVSAAVPLEATERVQKTANQFDWNLVILDAGEMRDPNYLSNPANRCFHCKNNLYRTILSATDRPVFSGANLDDLEDYRPGLKSAENHGIRHPFIEAGITKSHIRKLARENGLRNLSEIPASPCLSSRVLTGLSIDPQELKTIDRVETALRGLLGDIPIRCRRVTTGYSVQIDAAKLAILEEKQKVEILEVSEEVAGDDSKVIGIEPYKMGSAFLREIRHV